MLVGHALFGGLAVMQACSIYGAGDEVTSCIEHHKFQPNNFWNGRWRSQWTFNKSTGYNGFDMSFLRFFPLTAAIVSQRVISIGLLDIVR